VAAGVNVMDLRKGINKAIDAVIAHLKSKAWMIDSPEEINQVRYSNIRQWARYPSLFNPITIS
jgi:chaperonin GroEL (HSP60 family)